MSMSAPPTIQLHGWERLFNRTTLARGRECHQAGNIVHLVITPPIRPRSPWNIVGDVFGSQGDIYEVHIEGRSASGGVNHLTAFCTCPVGFMCKHTAALLYAVASQPAPAGDELTKQPGLSPAAREWLRQLRSASGAGAEAPTTRPAAPELLVYVLTMEPVSQRRGLRLGCFKVRNLKRGGFSREQVYYLSNLVNAPNPPRFAAPEDLRIARLAYVAGLLNTFATTGILLDTRHTDELLQAVLRTGRAFWERLTGPPLTVSAARAAQPDWEVTGNGEVRPAIRVEPPATTVLPLQPPWYYDAETHACGPLNLDLAAPLAAAWLAAPGIAATEVNALRAALNAPELAPAALPAPEPVTVDEVKDCPPVPVLRLATRMVQWWEVGVTFRQTGAQGLPCHYAQVFFEYRGLRAEWCDQRPVLQRGEARHILRVARQAGEERKRLDRLTGLGLGPAADLMYSAQHEWARTALTMDRLEEELWHDLLLQHIPRLEAEGWQIEYDENFTGRLVQPDDWYAELEPEGGGEDWFGLELGILVGGKKQNLLPVLLAALRDRTLSADEVRKAGKKKRINVRLPDGAVLPFPAGRLREILGVLIELFDPAALNGQERLRLNRVRAAQLGTLTDANWKWHGGDALRELGRKLGGVREVTPVPPPAGLRAVLRPYQLEGLSWLQFLREFELAGVLADDMGLGKTVQALAHLLVEKEAGRLDRPSLVVAPTSLMVNWGAEATRFAPDLKVLTLHGGERKQHFERLTEHDLVLTTYPLLLRDEKVLAATDWHLLILDEAQYIKNHRTQYAQLACALKARHRLCLTGTPMENHLGELWSLFNFLLPGFLGDDKRFRNLFRTPIEKGNDQERREVLSRRVAPFILRRRKEQVATELPPKTEVLNQVELTGGQRDLYESIRLAMHEKVRAEVNRKGMARSQIIILDALLKLRQVCCDPRLLKLETARKVTESAKLELLLDLLPEMLAEGRRILLFSQFTSMLALIEEKLAKLKFEERPLRWVKLTGDTTDRATPVNRFQAGEVPLFLISLKAGGTGLNLTAADTVIHYDPWWNPAVENQATDRAHRIGQDKKVFVYKLITQGTVEEKIVAMQERKRELVDGLLNDDRKSGFKLSADDIDFLFAPLEQTTT
jgi:superfamily II DNA or RNA helicase